MGRPFRFQSCFLILKFRRTLSKSPAEVKFSQRYFLCAPPNRLATALMLSRALLPPLLRPNVATTQGALSLGEARLPKEAAGRRGGQRGLERLANARYASSTSRRTATSKSFNLLAG